MDLVIILHAASTWILVGLIWTVQLVLYPLYGRVGSERFPDYHAAHMRGISIVVAPPMLIEAGTAAWLFLVDGERNPLFIVSGVFLLLVWASTALLQVSLHRRLQSDGYDSATCEKLTATNWIRTISWTVRGLLVAIWLL